MNKVSLSAVNMKTCKQVRGTNQPFLLVLEKGDNIIESLIECIKVAEIVSASVSGLGAIENPKVAYYNLETKSYNPQLFTGIYELVSLNGNITLADNELTAHIHVGMADLHLRKYGGHLCEGFVGVTVEITVIPFAYPITRTMNCDIGLKLITGN